MKFNKMLTELREERFMTKTALAKAVNSSRQHISLLENSEAVPSGELFVALADFFEVSVDHLLGRENYITLPRDSKDGYIMLPVKLTDYERTLVKDFANLLVKRRV
jgi:DNA-binding XRE family transcriptional regulator